MKKQKKSFKRKLKRLSYPITCRLVILWGILLRKISRNQARILAFRLGDFAYDFLRIRRGLVNKNLSITFPGKTSGELNSIAREVYRNQVLNIFEMLRIPLISSIDDAKNLVEIDSGNFFEKTIQQNKGAVFISAHLGSWEILAVCSGILLSPMNLIIKPLKNSQLDRYLNNLRTMHGNKVISKDNALREGLKVLKSGGIVGILGDQSNREGNFYIDFLGRKSTIFLGPAFLALKANVPVFVETCKRLDSGKYLLELAEINTSDLTYNKSDIKKLALRYTKFLEEYILKHPEEWLWLHDRWKRSPY